MQARIESSNAETEVKSMSDLPRVQRMVFPKKSKKTFVERIAAPIDPACMFGRFRGEALLWDQAPGQPARRQPTSSDPANSRAREPGAIDPFKADGQRVINQLDVQVQTSFHC